MMHFQLFLLIITFGAIFSNALVESVLTSAELSLDRNVRILVSEMKNLKDIMQKMEQIHQETVEDNRNLRTLVNSLSSKNEELESRLYYVEQFQRNRHQNDEFEDASDVLNSSENNSNKSSGVELGPFANTMKSLGHGIHSGRKTRSAESVSASDDGVVAFSAEVMDPISNLGNNQVIPFKSVLINTQNAFHGPTGIFTCPRAGLYAFFAKLLVYPDARIDFAITKNSDSVQFALGYSKGVATNKYDSGSAFGMVHLAVGDRVWVYVVNDAHEGSGKQVVKWMSSFMGFCLN